jgi:hypothetical protein
MQNLHVTHMEPVTPESHLWEAAREQWGKMAIGSRGDALLNVMPAKAMTSKRATQTGQLVDHLSKFTNFDDLPSEVQVLLVRGFDPQARRFGPPRQRQRISNIQGELN